MSRETLTTSAETPAELYETLQLSLAPALVRFAVDGEFTSADSTLSDGCEVSLIPPVAGG